MNAKKTWTLTSIRMDLTIAWNRTISIVLCWWTWDKVAFVVKSSFVCSFVRPSLASLFFLFLLSCHLFYCFNSFLFFPLAKAKYTLLLLCFVFFRIVDMAISVFFPKLLFSIRPPSSFNVIISIYVDMYFIFFVFMSLLHDCFSRKCVRYYTGVYGSIGFFRWNFTEIVVTPLRLSRLKLHWIEQIMHVLSAQGNFLCGCSSFSHILCGRKETETNADDLFGYLLEFTVSMPNCQLNACHFIAT